VFFERPVELFQSLHSLPRGRHLAAQPLQRRDELVVGQAGAAVRGEAERLFAQRAEHARAGNRLGAE